MTDKMQSLALAPVGNLDSYIRAANAWPMLSADEERALAEKLHYHGDLEAAKTLILSHLRFVVHIALVKVATTKAQRKLFFNLRKTKPTASKMITGKSRRQTV